MYTKCTEKECVIIALHVNDMLIFGTSLSVVVVPRFWSDPIDGSEPDPGCSDTTNL